MKTSIFSLFLLMLAACSQGQPQQTETSKAEPQRPGPNEVEQLIDKTFNDMIFVEGGSFMMGDPVEPFVAIINDAVKNGDKYSKYMSSDRNRPVHKVTLDSYYMGAYEVTFADYDIYTRAVGKPLVDQEDRHSPVMYSPKRPAGIGWNGARDYCQWLSEQTNLPFDLPTEAQWEYAARNRGQNVVFATDTGLLEPGRNFTRNDIPVFAMFPEEVGLYAPSPMGFYNLSDNAREFVKDWYAKDYYAHSPERNPQGPESGTHKVTRGGGFRSKLDGTTVARGKSSRFEENIPGTSFRCVINTDKPLPGK